MQKIEKGTDNGLFDWILESETHGTLPENNSAMIRVLVQKHNEMVDAFKKLKSIGKEIVSRLITYNVLGYEMRSKAKFFIPCVSYRRELFIN